MHAAARHLFLLPILVAALALRLFGLNWDAGQHLHPDERYIAMVESKITLPSSLGAYFDTARSPLNPYNNGFDAFAYGTLPLFVGRWLGELTGYAGYDRIVLLGRALSALADTGTVGFVYALASLLYGRRVGLIAAAILTFSVLDIQLSHFFAFDTFTAFFVAWSLYSASWVWLRGGWQGAALLGLGIGGAVACKISAITLLPIAALVCLVPAPGARPLSFGLALRRAGVIGLATIVTYRLAEPYAFIGTNALDLRPSPRFVADMLNWVRISSGEIEVPFMIQWTGTPKYTFVLGSILRWGLGPAAGLASLGGLLLAGYRLRRWGPEAVHLLLVVWTLLNLVYFGGQFAKFMRYLLPVYPSLAILAGLLVGVCWEAAERWWDRPRPALRWAARLAAAGPVVVLAPTMLWALAFIQIYTAPNTRVAASRWMIDNLPGGAQIGVEHWDDPLPLTLPGLQTKGFRDVTMTLYDEEGPEKVRKLLENLNRVDYLVLSSNRLYGSIPRLPQRYPLATEYYRALFDGRLGYEPVAEFSSRPHLFGLEIDDDRAQEDFTVYDHPKVTIFRRSASYDPARTAEVLRAVPLDGVQRVRPVDAGVGRAPLLSPAEWAYAQAGGTWSGLFDPDNWANRLAVPVWWLCASLIGLAAWPLLWRLAPHLADGGAGLARVLGLLLVAYVAWLAASVRLLPFGRGSIVVAILALGLASALALRGRFSSFLAYLRSAWPVLLAGEAAFALGFLICLGMRLVNPDLWHAGFGGEKPMDFAYLNAVIKSDYFPPYDPWFAGGSINYYYFGFVLVAALVKLTGIVPAVAYNLALALWFGLLCQASFSLGHNLCLARAAPGRPRARVGLAAGALAVLFVALSGNLDGAVQLRDALWKAGGSGFQSGIPLLGGLVRALTGLVGLTRGSGGVEFDFWRSTRLIGPEDPGPITEFPFFSFLYADLHAHLLALPLTLLAAGLALELLRSRALRGLLRMPSGPTVPPRGELARCGGLLLLAGLTLGALRATNTWDFPTYLGVIGLALACLLRPLGAHQMFPAGLATLLLGGAVFGLSSLLFAPYLDRYQLFYSGVDFVRAHTPLGQFLILNGFGLFALASMVCFETARRLAGRSQLGAVNLSPAQSFYSVGLPAPLEGRLDTPWAGPALVGGVILASLALIGLMTLALALALGTALAGLAALRWRSRETLFACALGILALAALSVPEVVAIKGDVGRMNTVFKFYYQAWTLLGLVGAVWLARLVARPRRAWPRAWLGRGVWHGALGLLVLAGLIYPLRGTPARLALRLASTSPTLDGMAFMQKAVYRDRDRDVQMPADYAALRWMQEHIQGTPVVLEANTGLYKWGSRVSVYTGLPTVVGWDWHQKQQRVGMVPAVEERLRDVKTMFETPSLDQVLPLLRKYGVAYIYVGGLERIYYPDYGLRKFQEAPPELVERVYEGAGVTIYRLRPAS